LLHVRATSRPFEHTYTHRFWGETGAVRSTGSRALIIVHLLRRLARSMPPKTLAADRYALYVKFRPGVPTGVKGWGQKASSI
jgi:hypothetical protein